MFKGIPEWDFIIIIFIEKRDQIQVYFFVRAEKFMAKRVIPTTIFDFSKGLGFDVLYHPVIGKTTPRHYPFITYFRPFQPKKNKKTLVKL